MLIDWFTVVAQIVNFLILVFLMKRYLWGPLVRGIDAREQRVAAALADAEKRSLDAAERVKTLEAEKAGLAQQASSMLEKARQSADARRMELIAEARANIEAVEKKWLDTLQRERAIFLDELRRSGATEILSITRSALHDLAGADLQTSAMQVFLKKLNAMDAPVLMPMRTSGVTVVTPAELPLATQAQVADAIANRLGEGVALRFETRPDMAWGMEMRGGGLRLGWTSDTYLDSLEQRLNAVIERLIASTPPVLAPAQTTEKEPNVTVAV